MNTLLIIMSHFDKSRCDTQPSVLPLDRMSANEGMPKLFVTVAESIIMQLAKMFAYILQLNLLSVRLNAVHG